MIRCRKCQGREVFEPQLVNVNTEEVLSGVGAHWCNECESDCEIMIVDEDQHDDGVDDTHVPICERPDYD